MKRTLYVAALCIMFGAAEAIVCTSDTLRYHWIVCEISSESKYSFTTEEGSYYLLDGSTGEYSCEVAEGMRLEIVCELMDLVLHRNGSSLGQRKMEWVFAVAEEVEGNYECRWPNGSLFGSRLVQVEGGPFIVPEADRDSLAGQSCGEVTPGVMCSQSGRTYQFDVSGSRAVDEAEHCEQFHVLGSRPISLSVDVLWVNHYPVDLQPQWRAMANNTTSLHVLEFTTRDLVFVAGTEYAQFYMAITANSSEGLATMCIETRITGDLLFFPNLSLPASQTVQRTHPAEFLCQAESNEDNQFSFSTGFSVAFLLVVPSNASHTDCYNCSFSRRNIDCSGSNTGACSGVEFADRSTGHPDRRTHELTAHWRSAGEEDNGTVVICAIASRGITQWANSATLTVLPSSLTPMATAFPLPFSSSPSPSPSPSLTEPSSSSSALESVLASLSVLVIVCGAGVGIGLGVVYWRRKRIEKEREHSSHEHVPLSQASLPSSGVSTPTSLQTTAILGVEGTPVITVSSSHAEQVVCRNNGVRRSLDSGLDVGNSAEDLHTLQVGHGLRLAVLPPERPYHSLSDLRQLPLAPSEAVPQLCVYVSYSDSQQEWVREVLCPLLLSFGPIEVTDHEGHMIAGHVISEERLRLIRSADKVVLVVSPDYQEVEWCSYELQHAVQQRPGAEGRLVPILCGGCRHLPSTIQTLHPILISDPAWQHKLRTAICRRHHRSS